MMILMGPWTEFYFFTKSVPLLIFAAIAVIFIGWWVVCWIWDLWTKLVHKITTRRSEKDE